MKKSPYYWIAEELLGNPTLIEKPMFGCNAFYIDGKLKLALTQGKEKPWKGVLIPTFKEYHASLIEEIPELESHSILGKWLYLSDEAEAFEEAAFRLIELILENDFRIGVEPKS